MKQCDTCGLQQPQSKYTADSFSPDTCFKCRVSTVRMGFSAGREAFHGDSLVGGTIKSDNDHTVKLAKANGHDPVPMSTAGGVGVTSKELTRLKSKVGF